MMPIRILIMRGCCCILILTLLAAKRLSHKVLMGMNFCRKFDAAINIP